MRGDPLRRKPSLLFVILIGWPFLLVRGAFSMRADQCRDCGEVQRYKSLGSWIALIVLVFLIFILVLAWFESIYFIE